MEISDYIIALIGGVATIVTAILVWKSDSSRAERIDEHHDALHEVDKNLIRLQAEMAAQLEALRVELVRLGRDLDELHRELDEAIGGLELPTIDEVDE